jgi:hypothetical protein
MRAKSRFSKFQVYPSDPEAMAIAGEIDPVAADVDALGAKAQALFETVFAGEENFSLGAEHAVPGNVFASRTQRPDDLTGCARVSRGGCDVTVGCYFAARDAADLVEDALEHQ